MLHKNPNILSVNFLGSLILLIAGLVYTKILSPVLQSASQSSPGKDTSLLMPITNQGTGYFISHAD